MNEPTPGPARLWAAVLLAAGVALALGGNVADNFRPEPSGRVPADTPLPTPIQPQGELPSPPAVFDWTPGGPDVALSQIVIFRSNYDVLWESAPLAGPPVTVIPEEVFAGVPAGEPLAWRVREVSNGRPRATTALILFSFDLDTLGRPVGESVPGEPLLPMR